MEAPILEETETRNKLFWAVPFAKGQGSTNIFLVPQTSSFKWMFGETTIFYVKIWNHPTETTIKKWMFRVPGWNWGPLECVCFGVRGGNQQGDFYTFGCGWDLIYLTTENHRQAVGEDAFVSIGARGRGGQTADLGFKPPQKWIQRDHVKYWWMKHCRRTEHWKHVAKRENAIKCQQILWSATMFFVMRQCHQAPSFGLYCVWK